MKQTTRGGAVLTLRILSLLLMVVSLWGYQRVTAAWAGALAANEAAAAAVERCNAHMARLAAQQEEAEQTVETGAFLDGAYTGAGEGFGGEILVSAKVEGGNLVSLEAISHPGEDDAYFAQAEPILQEMVLAQTWEVDAVSGATFSSNGLIAAAQAALEQAVRP